MGLVRQGRDVVIGAGAALVLTLCCAAAVPGSAAAAPPAEHEVGQLFTLRARSATLERVEGSPRFRLELHGVGRRARWSVTSPTAATRMIPARGFARRWRGYGFIADHPQAQLVAATGRRLGRRIELGRPRLRDGGRRISFPSRPPPASLEPACRCAPARSGSRSTTRRRRCSAAA